jgi:DNA-binding MarR family transcriptional regulator
MNRTTETVAPYPNWVRSAPLKYRYVAALEDRGLVGRHRDQADRRRLAIALSPAGHEFLDRYRDPVNALESRMLHGTTKPQVTALRRTLTTCHANLAPGQPRLP